MDIRSLPSSEAPVATAAKDRSIGALLVDQGKLSATNAEATLRHARATGLRFGDAAVALGFVTAADVQHALAAQFEYPYLPPGDQSIASEVVAAFAPFSRPVEALRAARTQLTLRWFGAAEPRKALAVVSPARGDGRSYLAANLAVVFSQLGERTLLVDADLRNPCQHRLFRLADGPGLAALLSGRAGVETVQRVPGLLGLSVLPAGAPPPNPQELLGRPAFGMLLEELGLRFDVILIDTPAAALAVDFQTVSAVTGGAVMVARRNVTRTGAAAACKAQVEAAGARLVGAILNER